MCSAQKYARISTWPKHISIPIRKWVSWVFGFLMLFGRRTKPRNYPFLKTIITDDEKWVFYDNFQIKIQWIDKIKTLQLNPKAEHHGRNVMLCVWLDNRNIIHLEFLTPLKHSMHTYTLNSCNECMKIFQENVLHSSIGETFCFSMITQCCIQQNLAGKNIGFRLVDSTP